MANSNPRLIDSLRDFTPKGLRELESWLEPWMKAKAKGAAGTASAFVAVEDEGVPLPVRTKINFIGSQVAAVDDPANARTNITVSQGGGVQVQDEGVVLPLRQQLNFRGATVVAADDAPNQRTNITVSGLQLVMQDEGTNLPVRGKLNFIGSGISAVDDSVNDRTNVTVSQKIIQDEGANLPLRDVVNFIGTGVVAADNPGAGRTDVTIDQLQIQDEGANVSARRALNFVGANVAASDDAANNRTNVVISVPPILIPVQDEGAAVATRAAINFVGERVQAVDDSANARVNVNIVPVTQTIQTYSSPGKRIVTNGLSRWYVPSAFRLDYIDLALGVAPAGSGFTVRINLNGASIGSGTLTVGQNHTTAALSREVVSGDYFTVDVTAVGSTTPGSDLVVQWVGHWH